MLKRNKKITLDEMEALLIAAGIEEFAEDIIERATKDAVSYLKESEETLEKVDERIAKLAKERLVALGTVKKAKALGRLVKRLA